MQRHLFGTMSLLVSVLLLTAGESRAVIPRVYPLAQIVQGSDWIASGPAAAGEPAKGRLALTLAPLKGTPPAGRTALVAPGQPGRDLLARVAPGQSLVLFGSNARGGVLFGFTNGTWFQAKRSGASWSVVSLHPEMARTWTGASADLTKLVRAVLAGTATAPAPDLKRKPALGPVIKKK